MLSCSWEICTVDMYFLVHTLIFSFHPILLTMFILQVDGYKYTYKVHAYWRAPYILGCSWFCISHTFSKITLIIVFPPLGLTMIFSVSMCLCTDSKRTLSISTALYTHTFPVHTDSSCIHSMCLFINSHCTSMLMSIYTRMFLMRTDPPHLCSYMCAHHLIIYIFCDDINI